MGILNVTPDSFSDGGRYAAAADAVAHGLSMAAAGADYVDVGGESTRPGASRIDATEELRRILPVIRELAAAGVAVSVDTMRAEVAEAAIESGAVLVNDVSGGRADSRMAHVVAAAAIPWTLMHWRGHSQHMYARASYRDVTQEVRAELLSRVDVALAAGVDPGLLVLDPGLGFAKLPEHDLTLLSRLHELLDLGFPVLVGASRKRFLGTVLAAADGRIRTAAQRDAATVATSALAAHGGAWGVRVHDVPATVDAVHIAAALDGTTAECARRT